MKVPTQITVGGKKIRVQYVDALPCGSAGEIEEGAKVIRVSKSMHADERAVFTTLFHELLHAALDITGHSAEWTAAQEEPIVYALENMLADLFVFNKSAAVQYREVDWPEAG